MRPPDEERSPPTHQMPLIGQAEVSLYTPQIPELAVPIGLAISWPLSGQFVRGGLAETERFWPCLNAYGRNIALHVFRPCFSFGHRFGPDFNHAAYLRLPSGVYSRTNH